MIYHSTRDEKLTAAPTRAVLEGIAPDGGLYVCDPGKLEFDWQGALQKDTMSMAADILGVLLPDFQDMNGLVRASYAGKFASDDLTPLVPVGERYVLELYHGAHQRLQGRGPVGAARLVSAAAKQEGAGDVVSLPPPPAIPVRRRWRVPRCARHPDHGVLSRRGRVAGAGGTDGDAGGQQRPGMRHPGELR